MALPAGITTANLTVGAPVSFSGFPIRSNVQIVPSAFLVHSATGIPLVNLIEETATLESVVGQFTLPHTDQSGFQDENGNAYTNWYYTATINYSTDKGPVGKPITKVFQVASGQTVVDLDLLPSGAPAMAYSAPVATVTSVAGLTGAVTGYQIISAPEVQTELSATYAPLSDLRVPLDIWDGFNVNGGNSYDFQATTYEQYIAGVHNVLSSKATREQIGTSQIGNRPIYAYTAGPANAPHALIVGGSHGIEWGSIIATFRFFQGFVSNDKIMAGLRSRLRITYIPVLSPDVYRSDRNNANNIDPNRNYAFNWDYYNATDPNRQKGTAAFSEGESKAAKFVLDKYKIAMVIDCHQKQAGRNEMEARGASTWIASNRKLVHTTLSQWDQLYNPNNRTYGEFEGATGGQPVLTNWAAKYLLFDKKRYNAAALTIEGDDNLAGSVHLQNCTREAVRMYCGYLHLALLEWLSTGQTAAISSITPTTNAEIYGTPDAAPGTAIVDSGQWIKSTTAQPVHWQSYPGSSMVVVPASKKLPFVDVAAPNKGTFFIQITGIMESATPNDQLVELTPHFSLWNGSDASALTDARLELLVPGTPYLADGTTPGRSRKIPFTITKSVAVPAPGDLNLYRAQFFVRRRTETGNTTILSKVRMTIDFRLDDEIYPVPRVLQLSVTGG